MSGARSNASVALTAPGSSEHGTGCSYLPELCAPAAVLGLVLIAELVAIALALARQAHWVDFFADLGRTSIVLLWLSLTSAAVLCGLRSRLASMPLREGSALAWGAVMLNVLAASEALYWWVEYPLAGPAAGNGWMPADHWFFVARNLAIAAIVTAGVLRYCYVTDQWQGNVRREAQARIHALQARIRPHFLFNSMNTIASLTRSNPAAAEQAVEDLADLFRASLADPGQPIRLADELEIARVYERMERQRLGDRLRVEWHLDDVPMDAVIPSLTVQPLLENAIYHGIERLSGAGVVNVTARHDGASICIEISNPKAPAGAPARAGNRMALDNIGERLQLAFGEAAGLAIDNAGDLYRVTLTFPYRP